MNHTPAVSGILSVSILLAGIVAADTAAYDFDDGTLQGWTNNVPAGTTGEDFSASNSTNSGRTIARSSDFMVLESDYGDRDAGDTIVKVLSSPVLSLTATNTISVWTLGGVGGTDVPTWSNYADLPTVASGGDFMGIALRRISDGEYLLFDRRSGSGQSGSSINWLELGWDETEISSAIAGDAPGEAYQVDLIDTFSGGWGWIGMDDVVIDDPAAGDTDMDGLPDEWEQQIIDAAAAEQPPVTLTLSDIKGPLNAPDTSDYDEDSSDDADEYANGTDPTNPDSDDDGLGDGVETNDDFWANANETGTDPLNPDTDGDGLLDGVENPDLAYDPAHSTTQPGTDPHEVDTDEDGLLDSDEVNLGSDPTDDLSLPSITGDLTLVGCDDFAYPEGPVAGLNGGEGFDFDNDLFFNTFIGHTTSAAAWTGSGQIVSGTLQTTNNTAFRRHEAPVELDGAVFAGEDYDAEAIYFRVDIDRDAGVSWNGISSYNGSSEIVFFGKNTSSNEWMFRIYGSSPETGTYSTGIPIDDQPHTLVGKIDFANEEVKMWVDPDLSATEDSTPANATTTYTDGLPSTATRLGSGGNGTVTWDHLVVAREWSALSKFPWTAAPDPIRITATSFDSATRTFSLTWESDPESTYTLWESPDLSAASWIELDRAIPGDAGASTTYPIVDLPAAWAEGFYRVSRNP